MLFWYALLCNIRKQTVVQHAEKATAQIDTFGFAPTHIADPSAKPKEPLLDNAPLTFVPRTSIFLRILSRLNLITV